MGGGVTGLGGLFVGGKSGTRFVNPGTRFVNPGTRFVNPGIRFVSPGIRFVSPGTRFVNPGMGFVTHGWLFVVGGITPTEGLFGNRERFVCTWACRLTATSVAARVPAAMISL